jgi:hypothetical protein
MNCIRKALILLFLISLKGLSASEGCCYCCPELEEEEICYYTPTHFFFVGPEAYYSHRVKEGGTRQSGALVGARASYDRVKRMGFYWGLEGAYATGKIRGHTGRGAHIVSELTDAEVEGRIGYTLQMCNSWKPSITPFVGLGYFEQTNRFKSPSPVRLHFRDSFKYSTIGFLSSFQLFCDLSVGANFKVKYPTDSRSRVSHDPEHPHSTLLANDERQYELAIPLIYQYCWKDEIELFVSLVPFFQYRHFGGYENYPYDYIDTKYYNVGSRLLIGFGF